MRPNFTPALAILLLIQSCSSRNSNTSRILIPGLKAEVEIVKDTFGVSHIYAENEHDLFMAQGYNAARDRLFQFEIWRRQATGTVSEILGPREQDRDYGARLFRYRGSMDREMNHYHPHGKQIIEAFVQGVNARISEVLKDTSLLPVEFRMLGIIPRLWTPQVVISRHQGLLGNIGDELRLGRAVALLGAERVKALSVFQPGVPGLSLDSRVPRDLLFKEVLAPYQAFRRPVNFLPEDVKPAYRKTGGLSFRLPDDYETEETQPFSIGSNNWIISGKRSATGFPLMANDPHRTQAVPSLRYMVHLAAPGWNVAGGGEPEIPGVSIGHNGYGAWGLTVFNTDGEDLMVYRLNPENPDQYEYRGQWKDFESEYDTIRVKGQEPHPVVYRYSVHGPVTFIDSTAHYATAMRCAWLEPGGSPYLASLMMDQAENWDEFRDACAASHIPGENMVWAGRDGHIGWQAVGIAPVRPDWSGLIPVPGDGSYEWEGYLPIKQKPHIIDPAVGFFSTANDNVIPENYPDNGAIAYTWAEGFRGRRIKQVLSENAEVTMQDMAALQTDYYAIPAEELVPLLGKVDYSDRLTDSANAFLQNWDYRLLPQSIAAGIYVAWEKALRERANAELVPAEAGAYLNIPLVKLIGWLRQPGGPIIRPGSLIRESFREAVATLKEKLGPDISTWRYGQQRYKHITLRHPLSNAVNEKYRKILEAGPAPRGGYAYTVCATGYDDNQGSGASFRILVNTGNWDETLVMNNPGQSGDPASPYYKNLFQDWAQDRFFPLYFTRNKIDSVAAGVFRLVPH